MGVDLEGIRPAVIRMLRVNMGLRPREKLLVLTDVPDPRHWAEWGLAQLDDICRRALLARFVAQIAVDEFPECSTKFLAYPCTGRSGAPVGAEVAERMKKADVIVAITSFSLTHTKAREDACEAGARVASMPGFQAEMFAPGGSMSADYERIAEETARIARLLSGAQEARVLSAAGTDVRFSLRGRDGRADDGMYTSRGKWGNLPAGEAYIAPVEGTAEGVLVVEPGWYPLLDSSMRVLFRAGEVVAAEGGGLVGQRLAETLGLDRDSGSELRTRRNLAELGIGTNPNARSVANVLEAEKIRGTVHLGLGDNSHMGGQSRADYHEDFVVRMPTLLLDGEVVMDGGRWVA